MDTKSDQSFLIVIGIIILGLSVAIFAPREYSSPKGEDITRQCAQEYHDDGQAMNHCVYRMMMRRAAQESAERDDAIANKLGIK